jgi:hypothetical protein
LNPEGKRPLGRMRHRSEANVKSNYKAVEWWLWVGLIWNQCISEVCPSSGIPKSRKHNVLETVPVSDLLGAFRRANHISSD